MTTQQSSEAFDQQARIFQVTEENLLAALDQAQKKIFYHYDKSESQLLKLVPGMVTNPKNLLRIDLGHRIVFARPSGRTMLNVGKHQTTWVAFVHTCTKAGIVTQKGLMNLSQELFDSGRVSVLSKKQIAEAIRLDELRKFRRMNKYKCEPLDKSDKNLILEKPHND